MNKSASPPVFSSRVFWDVNSAEIHFESKDSWVIARVFERGDVEDIRKCRRYYGDTRVHDVLLSTKYLPEHRLRLASAVIDEPLEKFRCFITTRSSRKPYPY